VWEHLLDVTKVARCMPGAQLTETVDDTTWKGTVGIKLGPVSMSFAGTVTLTDRDDATHHVVLKADGREQRGRGAASASVSADLQPSDGRTKVSFVTDLTITGAAAQYGRGMIQDISAKLTGQFASCLQANLAAERSAPAAGTAGSESESTSEAGAQQPRSAQPLSPASPVQPAPPAQPAQPAQPASAAPAPVKGMRLALWATWRALLRWFRRVFGRTSG
jgi:uncharacterized protein